MTKTMPKTAETTMPKTAVTTMPKTAVTTMPKTTIRTTKQRGRHLLFMIYLSYRWPTAATNDHGRLERIISFLRSNLYGRISTVERSAGAGQGGAFSSGTQGAHGLRRDGAGAA